MEVLIDAGVQLACTYRNERLKEIDKGNEITETR